MCVWAIEISDTSVKLVCRWLCYAQRKSQWWDRIFSLT